MDDFNVSNLYESKNEWASRLVNILTPLVSEGFVSILNESCKICQDNDEDDKYLMTFQNMISNIPSWSSNTVEEEKTRILESSGCDYMSDLITCVHVIQLKILTCVRVGQKQKPIEINIPSLDKFIHKVYINVARQLYSNVYLFETDILPLQVQKHNRELEIIIKECILNTVRDSIPVQEILKAYLNESTEEDITEEIIEDKVVEDKVVEEDNVVKNTPSAVEESLISNERPYVNDNTCNVTSKGLSFSNTDEHMSSDNIKEVVSAPKDIDTLEKMNKENEFESNSDDTITIHDSGNINLDILDINDVNSINNDVLIPDIEIL